MTGWPDFSFFVAVFVPMTQGMPSSRLIIEAWQLFTSTGVYLSVKTM